MNKTDLRVRVDARLEWISPPKDQADLIMREQANVRLKAFAHEFEKPLKKLIQVAIREPEA